RHRVHVGHVHLLRGAARCDFVVTGVARQDDLDLAGLGQQPGDVLPGIRLRLPGAPQDRLVLVLERPDGGLGLTLHALRYEHGRVSRSMPVKSFFPVNSSYRTRPRANRSLRAVTSSPASCSGAMYAGVPERYSGTLKSPAVVARPKSVRRTLPRPSSITLAGF